MNQTIIIVCFSLFISIILKILVLKFVFDCKLTNKLFIWLLSAALICIDIVSFDKISLLQFMSLNLITEYVILFILIRELKMTKRFLIVFMTILLEALTQGILDNALQYKNSTLFSPESLCLELLTFFILILIMYIIKMINRVVVKKFSFINNGKKMTYIYFIVTLLFGIILLSTMLLIDENPMIMRNAGLITCVITLINSFGILYYIKKDYENNLHQEQINQDTQIIKNLTDYIEQVNNNYNDLRVFKHDMNAYINMIQKLINDEDYIELNKLLKETNNLLENNRNIKCSNTYIASTLNNFVHTIETDNIEFVFEYDVFEQLQMKNIYICSLFYNLVQNAIESCKRCEYPNRKIELYVLKKLNALVIDMANSVPNDFSETYLTNKQTSKQDEKSHGLGLISIQKVVDEYNGDIEYRQEGSTLFINIVLLNVFKG